MRSFREAMARLGIPGKIIATDIADSTPAFHAADVSILVPEAHKPQYIQALLAAVKKHKVGLLIPLTDVDLLPLSRAKDKFARSGCTVMIGSEKPVMACMDKARTSRLIRRAGLATIRTCTLRAFLQDPFYPCFVKPIRGSASIGAAVIKNVRQLDAHLARFGTRMLVQECLPGQEFTIDVYRTRQGEVRCVVPRQRLVVRCGEVEKGLTVNDPALIEAAVRLSAHLGDIWGVFCCQCRRKADGADAPRFFEINPRFGGGVPLAMAAGADLPLYLLQEVTGRPITAKIGEFQDRLLMLRYDEAIYLQAGAVSSLPGFDTPLFR